MLAGAGDAAVRHDGGVHPPARHALPGLLRVHELHGRQPLLGLAQHQRELAERDAGEGGPAEPGSSTVVIRL